MKNEKKKKVILIISIFLFLRLVMISELAQASISDIVDSNEQQIKIKLVNPKKEEITTIYETIRHRLLPQTGEEMILYVGVVGLMVSSFVLLLYFGRRKS